MVRQIVKVSTRVETGQLVETVTCNLCGSEDHRFVYRAPDGLYFPDRWFDVVECRECGLGLVNPRLAIDEISAYYQSDYYDSLADDLHIPRFEAESRYLPEAGHGSPPPGAFADATTFVTFRLTARVSRRGGRAARRTSLPQNLTRVLNRILSPRTG